MFRFRRRSFCCCARPEYRGCCCRPAPVHCGGHYGCGLYDPYGPYDPYLERSFRPRRRRAGSREIGIRELDYRRRGRDFELDEFNEEDLEDEKDY